MYLAINILGVIVFLAVGWIFSKNRSNIKWRSVGVMVVLNLVIAWLLTSFSGGRAVVRGAAEGFNWLVIVAYEGIKFAIPQWVSGTGMHAAGINFIASALLPILLIVPMFDILTYVGILPWIIKWIGRGLSFVTGQPKFESFFAVEMMFLGNTEALAVSKLQLKNMKAERDVTLAMMSMSCVTASILGAYTAMVPGQFVLTAVPLNCINALIVTNMLNPVDVAPEEDTIAKIGGVADEEVATNAEDSAAPVETKREPFFSFLGDSILGAGTLILIITANVIAFVALAALIDRAIGWIPWPGGGGVSLEKLLGVIMFIPAWLMGLNVHTAWDFSQLMGLKLVTNEFVVMGQVTKTINSFPAHYRAVLTVFLTSFANFGTTGMIIGAFKGMVDKEKNDAVSSNVGYMLLSGILVSLLSAAMVGLFIW